MRKLFAMLLVLTMVFAMSATAFAAEEGGLVSESYTTSVKLHKIYTVTGEKDAAGEAMEAPTLFPAETLTFVSTPADTNPDADAEEKANLAIAPLEVSGNTDQDILITLPAYSKVGTYTYTISEVAPDPNTQGVGYTEAQITVTVLVEYDYGNGKLVSTLYLTQKPGEGETGSNVGGTYKIDTFTNTYDVGHLDVAKTVTGNLADQSKEFNVDVTFTSDKPVASSITYVDDGKTETIAAADINAQGGKTVTITVKHGETVHFYNIPAGVSYTVKEQDYTTGDKNGENGYDAPTYAVNGAEGAKAADGVAETAAKGETDTVAITNNKETEVSTGVILDAAPYVMMLLCTVAGVVVLFGKKRYEI